MKIQFTESDEIIELRQLGKRDYYTHSNNAGWEDFFYTENKLYTYFTGPYDLEIEEEIKLDKYKIIE